MPDPMPRWLLALVGIVAVVAILFGTQDYIKQRQVKPPVSTTGPTLIHSKVTTVSKKVSSVKVKPARMPATEANAPAAGLAAGDMGKPQIIEGFALANRIYDPPKSTRGEPGQIEVTATFAVASCLPLPNSTKSNDVDATYYQKWAGEYGCGLD